MNKDCSTSDGNSMRGNESDGNSSSGDESASPIKEGSSVEERKITTYKPPEVVQRSTQTTKTPQEGNDVHAKAITAHRLSEKAHTVLQKASCISKQPNSVKTPYPVGITGTGLCHLRALVNVWGVEKVKTVIGKETLLHH